MYSPEAIMEWIEAEIKPMRRSRQKTLAAVVSAAMVMRGVGVLALGRAMSGATAAKHCIKRVWRFFRNENLEIGCIQQTLANHLTATGRRRIVVLVDWTDQGGYKTLAAAIPRDGRALPVWWRTIAKESGEGVQKATEEICLKELHELLWWGSEVVIVADRGFGHTRWLSDVAKWGWSFVQRVSGALLVTHPQHYGSLKLLPILSGSESRDWGQVLLTDEHPLPVRLVTTFRHDAKEPWYLVTNLVDLPPEVVRIYQRRMWIEEMFRDLKNRSWGLGLTDSLLSTPSRQDRLWAVLALTYFLLCAFGAAAEEAGLDAQYKPNTTSSRVMSLARIGNYFLQVAAIAIPIAILSLNKLPP